MSIQHIANSLGGAKSTPEGFLCKCPCHDDKTASLSIKEINGGKFLFNCFAGCRWEDIKQELEKRGLLQSNVPSKTAPDKPPATYYVYYDLVGNPICRKVKLANKKQWIERYDSASKKYITGLNGITVPLYNLKAVTESDTVYLCEGEKDAESLITRGFCATTNHSGATGWASHFTEQLSGKTVIVIPDNDEAGKKRVAILSKNLHGKVKELRVFMPDGVENKGDITDWLELGNDASTIFAKSTVAEQKKKQKYASREEYFELFERVFNNPKRCIFNEKLMHYCADTNLWNPCINSLDIVRSEAFVENETRERKFQASAIQPHFFAYEASMPLEFLVDIPEWDGDLRIEAMASLLRVTEASGISQESVTELFKEWCSLVFQRLYDPMIQNRILVLQGGQGVGKDTWTSMLLDGLGQFCIPLAVVKEDKDTYLNLHRGLVMKISEFDKTSKTEVSTLKDIITSPSTNLRAPYDKDSKVRLSRCSFISSANAENLLRDTTGNRRFLIFEVAHIQYAYAEWTREQIKHWQLQCLAQMIYLAEQKYKASENAWREMNDYIFKKTPEDLADDLAEQFLVKIRADNLFIAGGGDLSPTDSAVISVFTELAKETGLRIRGVRTIIQSRLGIYKRLGNKRFWTLRIPPRESIERENLETPFVNIDSLKSLVEKSDEIEDENFELF